MAQTFIAATFETAAGKDNTAPRGALGTVVTTAGVAAAERGPAGSPLRTTEITLTAFVQTITDALAYGSTLLYTLPEGRILVLGVTANLVFTITSVEASTINNNASLTWGLGTAAASNITLSSTMIDLMPKTTKVLAAAINVPNSASGAALAASAQFDGTATAKPCYINFGFETNTDIDADGTLQVDGTILITWLWLGDY